MINNTTNLIDFLIDNYIGQADICLDMTAGNGHDSLKILQKLGPKKLYAFDIQERAREKTLERLKGQDLKGFNFILDNHKNLDSYVKEEVDFAIYNLGYLPGSDKKITTKAEDVQESLEKLVAMLAPRGKILMTFYPGHQAGRRERDVLLAYLKTLKQKDYTVTSFNFINQKNNPPFLVMVEKAS